MNKQGTSVKLVGLIVGLLVIQFSSFSQSVQSIPEGEYSVGFRYQWITNFAQNDCGEIGKSSPGKQVLLGIWYPASKGDQNVMKIIDYVSMNGLKGNDPIAKKIRAYANDSWISYTMMEYQDSTYTDKTVAFEQSLNFVCDARFEAKPLNNRFPVVIYHHGAGGTYDDNLMMCEYLASNGYVVISSSFLQCVRNTVFENSNWKEDVSDLQTVLTYIHSMNNTDGNNIALMGHSAGCQTGYAAVIGLSSPYKCFVGLDPTWDGKSYKKLYDDWGMPNMLSYIHSNRDHMVTPILHIASFRKNTGIPTDSAKAMNQDYQMQFPITDLFVHAERTMITTHPDHIHDAFISQGGYDCIRMKSKVTDPEDLDEIDRQINLYRFVCEMVLVYLDEKLKPSDKNSKIMADFIDYASDNEDIVKIGITQPKPIPTLEDEWPEIIKNNGLNDLVAILNKEKEESGYHQFSHEYLAQYFFHKNRELAKQIIDNYTIMYPESWKALYLKGLFAFNSGQKEEGKKFYEDALKKSPPDNMIDFLKKQSYYVWQ